MMIKLIAAIVLVYLVRYIGKTFDQFIETEGNPIVDCGNI